MMVSVEVKPPIWGDSWNKMECCPVSFFGVSSCSRLVALSNLVTCLPGRKTKSGCHFPLNVWKKRSFTMRNGGLKTGRLWRTQTFIAYRNTVGYMTTTSIIEFDWNFPLFRRIHPFPNMQWSNSAMCVIAESWISFTHDIGKWSSIQYKRWWMTILHDQKWLSSSWSYIQFVRVSHDKPWTNKNWLLCVMQYVCTNMIKCVYMCICIYTHVNLHSTHSYRYVYIYIYNYICICICMYMHT